MSQEQEKLVSDGEFYYSTYLSDIYSEAQYGEEDTSYRKQDKKHTKDEKFHWSLKSLFDTRMLIILISVVISSALFSSQMNNAPKPENFRVGVVISPPNVFDIKALQLPLIGSFVDKRMVFADFIRNIKSQKVAKHFLDDNQFYQKLKIKRGTRVGESADSVMISIDVKKPEIAKQWLDGFLLFSASQTVALLIKNFAKKIHNRKEDIKFKIDAAYVEARGENKELGRRIKRYQRASKIAKNRGIATSIGIDSLPKESRSGDLLYLQGYWQLDSEIDRMRLAMSKQEVDVESEQQELKDLESILPNPNDIKVFLLERTLKIEDLNSTKDKQAVWNIVGGFIGLMLGMIISRPFRRKKKK